MVEKEKTCAVFSGSNLPPGVFKQMSDLRGVPDIPCVLDTGKFDDKISLMNVEGAFSSLCDEAIGRPITHVWQGHGSAIFLEVGGLTSTIRKDGTPGNPKGAIGVNVEWSWRIEAHRSILCGSWSDEQLWHTTFERFKGARITSMGLFGALPELVIETHGGLRFLSFSTLEGQPQWSVVDRRETVAKWYCVDDGNLVFQQETEK